jgi:hypothetical protein
VSIGDAMDVLNSTRTAIHLYVEPFRFSTAYTGTPKRDQLERIERNHAGETVHRKFCGNFWLFQLFAGTP